MKPLRLLALALALIASGCGASPAFSPLESGRFEPVPGFSGAGDDDTTGDDDGASGDDDDDSGDDDDDNSGDDDDNDDDSDDNDDSDDQSSACEGFALLVTNEGVSAARVGVNGVELVATNDFPTNEAISVEFTAAEGANIVGVWLAGSPGDEITVEVVAPDGTTLAGATVARDGGHPEVAELGFAVSCGSIE